MTDEIGMIEFSKMKEQSKQQNKISLSKKIIRMKLVTISLCHFCKKGAFYLKNIIYYGFSLAVL